MPLAERPIGVFDSGIGGLSVLRALRAELPHERFVYLADSSHAPYGERDARFVAQRTHAITAYLRAQHHIKALVVACNTATAAAIHEVRSSHADLPLVGVEPALKPAVQRSQTRRIGVIGTRGTLGSEKFRRLHAALTGQAEFILQACDGLAHAIEHSTEQGSSEAADTPEVRALCARYISVMGRFGTEPGEIDTLVLGCTHYVFALPTLRALVGPQVQIIDTGAPVARQTRRLLEQGAALAPEGTAGECSATLGVQLLTTGALAPLQTAAARWLQLPARQCDHIDL